MAERLLVRCAEEAGVKGVTVTSAGLAARDGRAAEPVARRVAAEFGVSLDGHSARRVSAADLESADVVLVMDRRNEAVALARARRIANKLFLLGAYLGNEGAPEISDPYGRGEPAARACFEKLNGAVGAFAAEWARARSARSSRMLE
jgi:protein-tyrosine phosphatase